MKHGATLAGYLSRVFLGRILAATAVLTLLGLSLDLIKAATSLIEERGAAALALYAGLRTVQIASTMLPTGILIGATLTFFSLANRSEIVVLRATGQSVFGLLRLLLPLAIAFGLVHHLLGDRPVAWAEARLIEAFPIALEAPAPGATVWSRLKTGHNTEILRARLGSRDGDTLDGVTLWFLDDRGRIESRLEATRAEFVDGAWHLADVQHTGTDERTAKLIWETPLTPRAVRRLAARQTMISASDARAVMAGLAIGSRGESYYATRVARSYAAFAVPAVMILLGAQAGFALRRAGHGYRTAALGLALGLIYVAANGIMGSLGEAGAIAPLWAAAVPTVVFALVGAWALMLRES